ncbi:protein-glutamate methylesterase/protein-glutamine glutaminase [Bacillus tuaregi]|uniref:protein-glutamate methylesterase/protein-glutamine glutaminase n=1 Tax=Bacillus tuaregi TaxID=1816695 RepID=UPI000B1541CD|nr:chemotaxis response regulator protein-glutamate methylesterase [Bacillus tuaregi]
MKNKSGENMSQPSAGKIRVIIVDDSIVFREVLAMGVSIDPAIEVVAKAVDPFDARDQLLQYHPDVMICDVQMPRMNGIEFINRLLPQYPIPVIVVTQISSAVFDALNAGAVDFVTKPNVQSPVSVEDFINDLIFKIKIAAQSKVSIPEPSPDKARIAVGKLDTNRLIAMGASTGGTEALFSIIKALPSSMPGILIVQHIPSVFSRMFAERLNNQTALNVKEAEDGDVMKQGQVLVAPGGKHMRIKRWRDTYKVEILAEDKVNGHCPSIDVLFESVAKEAGRQAIGIILTGMGYDGAKGLLAIRRKGGRTIGQDEETSVVYGMPKASFNIGAVEKQAPLHQIPQILLGML